MRYAKSGERAIIPYSGLASTWFPAGSMSWLWKGAGMNPNFSSSHFFYFIPATPPPPSFVNIIQRVGHQSTARWIARINSINQVVVIFLQFDRDNPQNKTPRRPSIPSGYKISEIFVSWRALFLNYTEISTCWRLLLLPTDYTINLQVSADRIFQPIIAGEKCELFFPQPPTW